MKNYHDFSDEQLNAFVDDELGPVEKNEIFLALKGKTHLSDEVCELRKMKSLVQHAYEELPLPETKPTPTPGLPLLGRSMVAGLLLMIGGAAGWWGHTQSIDPMPDQMHQQFSSFQAVELQMAEQGEKNVILHLSTNDPFQLAHALDETEKMLAGFKKNHLNVRVEIVANGDGLELLRTNTSLFPERTQALVKNFDNVTIMACANTLSWLDAQGVDITLLPNINTTSSALEKVVERLKEGWLYIRV